MKKIREKLNSNTARTQQNKNTPRQIIGSSCVNISSGKALVLPLCLERRPDSEKLRQISTERAFHGWCMWRGPEDWEWPCFEKDIKIFNFYHLHPVLVPLLRPEKLLKE